MLPASFILTSHQITIETLEPLTLPPVKAQTLRGGFGFTFHDLVCSQQPMCGKTCKRGNQCSYGYIFETSPPKNSEVLRNYENIPRPFIISAPIEQRTHFERGEWLTFQLIIVGYAINFLPHFITVFEALGQRGLGHKKSKYQLLTVSADDPLTGWQEVIYHAGSELIQVPEATITTDNIMAYAQQLPTDQITLTFSSPTRLKHKGGWIRHGPPFQSLIRILLGRISSLSYFHCGEAFEADFRGLIDQASEIEIVNQQTEWVDWSRQSRHQKTYIKMGGLMGQVTYQGDLTPYLPLLALGQFIHAGKGTVFGNGQYHILA